MWSALASSPSRCHALPSSAHLPCAMRECAEVVFCGEQEAMELPEEDKVVWIQLKVDVTEVRSGVCFLCSCLCLCSEMVLLALLPPCSCPFTPCFSCRSKPPSFSKLIITHWMNGGPQALIKRLLKLCDGDVGRALMLAQNAKRRAESKKQLV